MDIERFISRVTRNHCHLYIDQIGWGGTLILHRIGVRWGSHAAYFHNRIVLYLDSGIKKVL